MVKKIHILKDSRGLGVQISMKLNHATGEKGVFVSDISPGGAAARLMAFINFLVMFILNYRVLSIVVLIFQCCMYMYILLSQMSQTNQCSLDININNYYYILKHKPICQNSCK